MFLSPQRKLELRSVLSVSAAAQAIANEVEPKKWLRFGSGARAFEGAVSESSFEVQRIIHYRNSFLPQIRGDIRAASQGALGCTISIRMSLHPFVLIFMAVWLGVVSVAAVGTLTSVSPSGVVAFVPLGMLLLAVLMVLGGFWYEAKKAELLLVEIFAATL